jgi:hypothetical protein
MNLCNFAFVKIQYIIFPLFIISLKINIYYIVIHQQQIEDLFNKLDLKTHANMSLSMKQSKPRLSSSKISKENLASELKEMRRQRNETRKTPLQEAQFQTGSSKLFKRLICNSS